MQRKPFLLIQIIPRNLRSGQYKIQAAGCRPGTKCNCTPGTKPGLKHKVVLITCATNAVVGNTGESDFKSLNLFVLQCGLELQ